MENTAPMQLIEWINSDCTPMDCVMKAKELLEVKKEQIFEALEDGFDLGYYVTSYSPEDYYNSKYGKDES